MANFPMPPLKSPRPPQLHEEKTDPGLLRVEKRLRHGFNWKITGAAIGTVATGMFTGLTFIDNRVAAQTDAGIKVHEQRLTTVEVGLSGLRGEVNNRLERVEQSSNRQETKMDALLERLRVVNPAPKPEDAGQ